MLSQGPWEATPDMLSVWRFIAGLGGGQLEEEDNPPLGLLKLLRGGGASGSQSRQTLATLGKQPQGSSQVQGLPLGAWSPWSVFIPCAGHQAGFRRCEAHQWRCFG